MSYIANTLDGLLKEKNKTAAEIARFCGFTDAHISRIKNGIQVWVAGEDLEKMAGAFESGNAEPCGKTHATLLYAHLLDECSGPGAKYIHIELLSQPKPNGPAKQPESEPVLPPKMQDNLNVIAQHITQNRNIRDLVETAANICRGSLLPQPDSK